MVLTFTGKRGGGLKKDREMWGLLLQPRHSAIESFHIVWLLTWHFEPQVIFGRGEMVCWPCWKFYQKSFDFSDFCHSHTVFFVCLFAFWISYHKRKQYFFLVHCFFPTSKICVHSDFSLVDISIVLNGTFKWKSRKHFPWCQLGWNCLKEFLFYLLYTW